MREENVVIDMVDMAQYISEKTEIDIKIVIKILDSEFDYLTIKGLVEL